MKNRVLLFIFLLTPVFSFAQTTFNQTLTNFWTDLNPRYRFNNNLDIRGDLAFRWNENYNRQLYIVRPVFAWVPNKTIGYRFGASMFYSNNFYSQDDIELRLHQAAIVRWPQFSGWDISHRFMVEERWIYQGGIETYDFLVRTRYRLRLIFPEFGLFGLKSKFFVPISLELLGALMVPDVIAASYQDRLTVGLGNKISKSLRLEFHYQSHGSRFRFGDGFKITEDVWRLRLFYLINPDKA